MGVELVVSRTMQERKETPKPEEGSGGTPIWVWVVYGLGLFAATVIFAMVLFNIGALYLSDEGEAYDWNVTPILFVWCVPIVAAAVLWIYRRRR